MRPPSLTPAQQAAAVDRAGRNTVLLSGAGCGKTFVLARRFTELLLRHPEANDPQARAEAMGRFVALTFTDKAALEMAQRVRSLLRRLADQAGSDADRQTLRGWLEAACEARISTIHGFCAGLLRACAVEAGLDPAFRVCAETVITDRLLAQAAEETLLEALENDDAELAKLLSETSFEEMVKLLRTLLSRRTHCRWSDYLSPSATQKRWQENLEQQRRLAQDRLRKDDDLHRRAKELDIFQCSDPTDKLLPFVENARRAMQTIFRQPLEQCAEAFETLRNSGKPGNAGSPKCWSAPPKEVRDALKALVAAAEPYALYAESLGEKDEQAAQTVATLARLAQAAEERYRRAKQARSLLDFDDLILYTRDLLTRRDDIRRRLAAGIDQMLIDEAQDTDSAQRDLLLPLLQPEANQPLPDGKLFLVGDAKQSIYRFRGAEVEVFGELREMLGPESRVDLDLSFRTHPAGVCFVNEVFAPMLGADYTPLQSRRAPPHHPTVEILLAAPPRQSPDDKTPETDFTSDQAVEAQAALLARRVEEMLTRSERLVWDAAKETWRAVRPGDIAILFSRMTKSLPYERELQKRNLPYYVVAGAGFFQQQEVLDVLNALRAVENPHDDLAVFGALRSALFGLSDDTLAHLAETHSPPCLPRLDPDRLAGKISEEQMESLRFARDLLTRLAAQKDALGVEELLRRLLGETGCLAALLTRPQGRRMAGNLQLLLDQARAATGQMTLAEFLEEMEEQTVSESRFEQASVAGEDEDVIRLMTIHKAKGLEFPVVFVPDLNRSPNHIRDKLLIRRDGGLTTKLLPGGEVSEASDESDNEETAEEPADLLPLSYRLAREAERRDQEQEMLRNYYVALTRHEDYLVLVGADRRDRTTGRFQDGRSFLARLDDVLGIRRRLEAQETDLPYADGRFRAVLRREETPPPPNTAPNRSLPLETSTPTETVAAPLLGPLPETLGHEELAVTALSDFERCPALFHWRQELHGPEYDGGRREEPPAASAPESAIRHPSPSVAGLSAPSPALLGTLLHRCLEWYDFDAPPSEEELVRRVLAEQEEFLFSAAEAEEVSATLREMLSTFRRHPLAERIAAANTRRCEVDFLLRIGRLTLRGQIDLLYRDARGDWYLVDYKSDRLSSPVDLARQAKEYELQLLVYALAVERFFGQPPAEASLYFLRTGQMHRLSPNRAMLAAAEQRIESLAKRIVSARRTGCFPRCGQPHCPFCRMPLP